MIDTLFDRHRTRLVVFVTLFSIVALIGWTRIEFDNEAKALFRNSSEEFSELEMLFKDFRPDENDCMLLIKSPELLTVDRLNAMRELHDDVAAIQGVEQVISLVSPLLVISDPLPRRVVPPEIDGESIGTVRKELTQHPLASRLLLSRNADHALLIAQLGDDDLLVSDYADTVKSLHETVEVHNQDPSWEILLTGLPPLRTEVFSSVRNDTRMMMKIGAGLAGIIALLVFRHWAPSLVTFAGASVGAVWALGVISLLGIKINLITTIVPVLVVVIGLTDAVHLVFDMRESVIHGVLPRQSAIRCVAHLGLACFLTSVTTAIGFGSLMVSSIHVISQLGLVCALGTGITFIGVITVVPLLGGTSLVSQRTLHKGSMAPKLLRRFAEWMIDAILRRKVMVLVFSLAVITMLGWYAMKLRPDAHLYENLPPSGTAAQALNIIDDEFGGLLTATVIVQWDDSVADSLDLDDPVMTVLDRICRELDTASGLNNPLSAFQFAQTMPLGRVDLLPAKVRHQWIQVDNQMALVTARMQDTGIESHRPMVADFRETLAHLEEEYSGFTFSLSGSAVVAMRSLMEMISDLVISLTVAAVVIFIVLSIAFRSIKLGLISILPNSLPLLFTAAFLVWVGEPLRITSVLLFTVSLGIAVDDTIHFLTRFQRERQSGASVHESIKRTFMTVGGALVTSTAILVAGFSASALSEMPHAHLFAELACISIAVALLGDVILLPAILSCSFKDSIDTA